MEKGQYPLLFLLHFVRCGVSYCGAVAPRVTAALLGRFLPRLGPLAPRAAPFSCAEIGTWPRARNLVRSFGGSAVGPQFLQRDFGKPVGQKFEVGGDRREGGRAL